MKLTIQIDRETDGRWIAEVPELAGVLVYGSTRSDAVQNVKSLALHVIADRISEGYEDSLTTILFRE